MKLYRNKNTGELFVTGSSVSCPLTSFTGRIILDYDPDNYEEVETGPEKTDFRRWHIVEQTVDIGYDRSWHLKDVLFVLVDGKEVAFRVEHISDDKVYFVAVDAVGKSNMNDMEKFLNDYLKKMPKSLVNAMCEIEHKVNGNLIRKSKLTLLSRKNVTDSEFKYDLNGADDILFDGLQTEAKRCKDFDGETEWYWLDTPFSSPNASNSATFMGVYHTGYPGNGSNASSTYAVVPCFAIKNKMETEDWTI